jgi:hypothetical protein
LANEWVEESIKEYGDTIKKQQSGKEILATAFHHI